jgi:ParB family chromosome partitioning protein
VERVGGTLIKRKVLGRGLGALIKDNIEVGAPAESKGSSKYFLCKVSDITPNRLQPRRSFDDHALSELTASIKEKGVIEPLVVKHSIVGYELIAGERRLRASKLAGLVEVPVVVLDVSDEESLEIAIIENIQREDLNAIDEAKGYHTLMDFGLSQVDVAKKVGKPRATVANYLRLLKLPMVVKQEISNGAISMGHAKALLSIESHAAQRELLKKILSGDLSVRATESLVKKALTVESTPGEKRVTANKDDEFKAVEESLRRKFATKVTFKEKRKKGRIEFEYYSIEERERLIELFMSVK